MAKFRVYIHTVVKIRSTVIEAPNEAEALSKVSGQEPEHLRHALMSYIPDDPWTGVDRIEHTKETIGYSVEDLDRKEVRFYPTRK